MLKKKTIEIPIHASLGFLFRVFTMAEKRVSSLPSSCEETSDCNDGECSETPDGHSECECLPGFVGPHCTFRDPCVSEGQLLCQNGSTCKRMNNLSYECKCRPPYVGEFCTDYDLCDIDVDECMEDLKTDNDAPFCHPCIEGAKCTRVGNGVYTCDCNMELNPSGCFAKEYLNELETVENVTKANADITTTTIRNTWPTKNDNLTNFTTENISVGFPRQGIGRQLRLNGPTTQTGTGSSSDFWIPIIPAIAITSCALYIILLIIFLVLVCKRRRHPRLIVCCANIHYFDYFSYYLISVETGSRCCAGTRANVYCFLHGEYDIAGPYPLYDPKLAKKRTLQRGQEDNFLVSHTKDLGRVTKIVIWYDDPKRKASSWYCDKITVRDVKAEVNWLFYISTRFHSRDKRRAHEFPAATTEHVRKLSAVKFNARHYFYQLLRYHVFLAPIAFLTLERLTLLFTEWLGYMFVLIALYGFISQNDSDRTFNATYTFRLLVLENGSIAGFAIFFVGFALLILILIIYWSDRRVPTLIIWRNKPTALDAVNHKPPVPPRPPSLPLKLTRPTNTTGPNPLPAAQALSSDSGIQVFRIPSTNVTKTEDWVETRMKRGDEDLANLYKDSRHRLGLNDNDTILEYGLTGALTDGRQLEPNRFVYTTNSNDDSRDFRAKVEKDVRLIYATTPVTTQNPEESISVSNVSSKDTDISMLFATTERNRDNNEDLAGGDHHRTEDKRVTLYFEFCEMGLDRSWRRWGIVSIIVCWILCISIIITATVISCIYGERYGFQRTFDWIISLVICLAQDFFIYQFLKSLLIVGTVTICMKLGAWPTLEASKLSERFQVYYLNGLGVLPDKVNMGYFEYLPNDWESTKHVVISPENRVSRFDKHNEL